jgi:hypothetical protein
MQIDKTGSDYEPRCIDLDLASQGRVEIAAIFLPLMPTLRTASRPDSGSITRPPCKVMSYVCPIRSEGNGKMESRIAALYPNQRHSVSRRIGNLEVAQFPVTAVKTALSEKWIPGSGRPKGGVFQVPHALDKKLHLSRVGEPIADWRCTHYVQRSMKNRVW